MSPNCSERGYKGGRDDSGPVDGDATLARPKPEGSPLAIDSVLSRSRSCGSGNAQELREGSLLDLANRIDQIPCPIFHLGVCGDCTASTSSVSPRDGGCVRLYGRGWAAIHRSKDLGFATQSRGL
jgi:hypothetical protein